ncbi:hypothetical protein M569_14299, partial [Genlisea aurea]
SNFSIKCGGPQFTSSTGIVFESDNETLGPATYYVTSTRRWAVSNVGLPITISGIPNPKYQASTLTTVGNTLDPQIFQTARVSSGSLR